MRRHNEANKDRNIERFCSARDMLNASEDKVKNDYLDLLSELVDVAERYHGEVSTFDDRVKTAKFRSNGIEEYQNRVSRMDHHKRNVHEALISSFYAANRKVVLEAKRQGRLDEFVGGLYTGDPLNIKKESQSHRDAVGAWAYDLVQEIYDSGSSCCNILTLDDKL